MANGYTKETIIRLLRTIEAADVPEDVVNRALVNAIGVLRDQYPTTLVGLTEDESTPDIEKVGPVLKTILLNHIERM